MVSIEKKGGMYRLRIDLERERQKGKKCLLPDAVPPERHQVVHAVVRLGDAVEDAGHALRLLGLGEAVLEPEVCRSMSASVVWWWCLRM